MLDDIRTFADLQAVLTLATDPTLVTLEEEDGEFIIVSVDVDTTGTNNTDGTEVGLVEYTEPEDLPSEPSSRPQALQSHLFAAKAQAATKKRPLRSIKTYKKPPNGG
jgi:hypothetical protein